MESKNAEPKYLSLRQVCELLNLHYQRVYIAQYRGKLPEPALKVGHARLYGPDDIERVRQFFYGVKLPN